MKYTTKESLYEVKYEGKMLIYAETEEEAKKECEKELIPFGVHIKGVEKLRR